VSRKGVIVHCIAPDGQKVDYTVQAYRTKTPGLVVHKHVGQNGAIQANGRWGITHAPSGYAVRSGWSFKTLREARAACKDLGSIPEIDWSLDGDVLSRAMHKLAPAIQRGIAKSITNKLKAHGAVRHY